MSANETAAPPTVKPATTGPNVRWARPKKERNYLLKPEYRQTSVKEIYGLTERAAAFKLAEWRWGMGERQVCPTCGTIDKHYWLPKRLLWECRAKVCRKQFSVFSGTKLHGTKMPPTEVMAQLFSFVEAKDSISAREMSGREGRDHQTLHILLMKVRESIRQTMQAEPPLVGYIQADAAYFIKYVRPGNLGTGVSFKAKDERKNAGLDEDASVKATTNENMVALVVFVQAGKMGMRRYRVALIKTENQVDLLSLGQKFCKVDSVLMTDQHSGYNFFSGEFLGHVKVNHSETFMNEDGIHTNYAEGFFARMRAASWGAWHRTSAQNLEDYGWEMAWRQTMAGSDNLTQLKDLFKRICDSERSERFRDYWHKLPPEMRPEREELGTLREMPKDEVGKKRGRPAAGTVKAQVPETPKKRGPYRYRGAVKKAEVPAAEPAVPATAPITAPEVPLTAAESPQATGEAAGTPPATPADF
jgi:hypothetical protein